jgi:hypothetical protein
LNRWYCSQEHGREIRNPESLVRYYVGKGGAEDFERRFAEAMSPLNRWYCSQFYRRDIRDPDVLWTYYTKYALSHGPGPHNELNSLQSESGIAG